MKTFAIIGIFLLSLAMSSCCCFWDDEPYGRHGGYYDRPHPRHYRY